MPKKSGTLVTKGIARSGLDPLLWDQVGETQALWFSAAQGYKPAISEVPPTPLGVVGVTVLPKEILAKHKPFTSARGQVVVLAGVERRTTVGCFVLYFDHEGKIRRTIVNYGGVQWTEDRAFRVVMQGAQQATICAPIPSLDGVVLPSATFAEEAGRRRWLRCDGCNEWRSAIDATFDELQSRDWLECTDIPKSGPSSEPGEFWECGQPREPLAQKEADEIEEILDYRRQGTKDQYLVWWGGTPRGSAVWEDGAELVGNQDMKKEAKRRAVRARRLTSEAKPPEPSGIAVSAASAHVMRDFKQDLLDIIDSDEPEYDDEAPAKLFVVRGITKSERSQYPHLDWEAAKAKECAVFREFGVIGKAWERSVARRVPGAVFSNVHAVSAVKGDDLPPEMQQARVRGVLGGNNMFDARGTAAVFAKMYALPAEAKEVVVFWSLVKLLAFQVTQGDVSAAYLHETLEALSRPHFVSVVSDLHGAIPPEEFEKSKTMTNPVFELLKALYGHELAGFIWDKFWSKVLGDLGFTRDKDVSNSLWVLCDTHTDAIVAIIVTYVDDFLLGATRKKLRQLQQALKLKVKIKEFLDPGRFIGCDWLVLDDAPGDTPTHSTIIRDMRKYFRHAVEKWRGVASELNFKISNRAVRAPITRYPECEDEGLGVFALTAPSHIGTLLFGARMAGPCESYAVGTLATRIQVWTPDEDKLLAHLYKWIEAHQEDVLVGFVDSRDNHPSGGLLLTAFVDSDHAGDKATRKSWTSVQVWLFGRLGTKILLTWIVRRQTVAARSSGHTETTALYTGARELVLIGEIFEYVLRRPIPQLLLSDSSCARAAAHAGFSAKMREVKVTEGVSISFVHDMFPRQVFE